MHTLQILDAAAPFVVGGAGRGAVPTVQRAAHRKPFRAPAAAGAHHNMREIGDQVEQGRVICARGPLLEERVGRRIRGVPDCKLLQMFHRGANWCKLF